MGSNRATQPRSRSSSKLAGSDFPDQASKLEVATQVHRLIAEAQSDLNLCQLYGVQCELHGVGAPHVHLAAATPEACDPNELDLWQPDGTPLLCTSSKGLFYVMGSLGGAEARGLTGGRAGTGRTRPED